MAVRPDLTRAGPPGTEVPGGRALALPTPTGRLTAMWKRWATAAVTGGHEVIDGGVTLIVASLHACTW